jgi:hypothetical protein
MSLLNLCLFPRSPRGDTFADAQKYPKRVVISAAAYLILRLN